MDGPLHQHVTRSELDVMFAHIIRCEDVMACAFAKLDRDDFDQSEFSHRAIWILASEFWGKHKKLPPKEILEVMVDGALGEHPEYNAEHVRDTVFGLLDMIFSWPSLMPGYALDILQSFLWQRQVAPKIMEAANSGFIQQHIWESIKEQEDKAKIDRGLDLAERMASVRLLAPDTFKPATFVTSGYSSLDGPLGGGLALGNATSVFAPASTGKTTFAANMALNMALAGVSVAFISLEMTDTDIWRLVTGIQADIPRYNMRRAMLNPQERHDRNAAINRLITTKLFVLDRRAFPPGPDNDTTPDMDRIGAVIQDGVRKHGWQVVVVDYLSKVGPFDDEDITRMPRLTNWVCDLAQRNNIHLVALAQSNKAAFTRKDPDTGGRTTALQDTKGAIETVADFDNVIGISRDDWNTAQPQDPAELVVRVLKARQGPTGTANLIFYKKTGTIKELLKVAPTAPLGPSAAQPQPSSTSTPASATSTALSPESMPQALSARAEIPNTTGPVPSGT
ncbi:MAG: DnaB-like helicase C-terminal domain-containing protein [Planctomycetota bacterium]